jgi:hypothetical protein
MSNLAKKFPDEDDAAKVTQMVMRLFEHWELTYEQQASLLSISTKGKGSIARYKNGATAIQMFDRDKKDRIGHLLAIHKYLRILFPKNRELVYKWPKSKNKYFNNKTPIETIIDDGFVGLLEVRHYLEKIIAG